MTTLPTPLTAYQITGEITRQIWKLKDIALLDISHVILDRTSYLTLVNSDNPSWIVYLTNYDTSTVQPTVMGYPFFEVAKLPANFIGVIPVL